MNTGKNRPAFTLVELMIVIVIISILAGLTTIGTRIAIHKSKDATVSLTLEQLAMAVEKYKNDIGEYPPDFTDLNAVTRHVRKRWPRCDYADEFVSLANQQIMEMFGIGEDKLDEEGWRVTSWGPASALIFWLGGMPDPNQMSRDETSKIYWKPNGFFLSPTDPLGINETSSQREEPRFNFPDDTIIDGENCRKAYGDIWFDRLKKQEVVFETITYNGPVFQPGKKAEAKPVVYFCASAPAENDLAESVDIELGAYQLEMNSLEKYCFFEKTGSATPYAKTFDGKKFTWYEADRFQLIHPGYDGYFSGSEKSFYEYPYYPCTQYGNTRDDDCSPTKEADDNIVNFAEGGTLESLYPKQ